jgi:hypothetical protein
MALSSTRPFSPAPPAAASLRGLAEDLVDLRHRVCDEHGILAGDYLVLQAIAAISGPTLAELASAAHHSPAGLLAAIDRLDGAGYARSRGKAAQGGGPVMTDSGRLMVAGIDGTIEATLDAVLETAGEASCVSLSRLLDACRTQVWDVGAAPVVAVLEP